jgi:hypothetical protein
MKGKKPSFIINALKITNYSTLYNMSNKIQFDLSSVFNPYMKFCNFKLSKVNPIWKLESWM